MPSALVLCNADPASDPRPNRMIRCLARDFDVTVMSRAAVTLPGMKAVQIPPLPRRPFVRKLWGVIRMRYGHYRDPIWTPGLRRLATAQRRAGYDVIAVHDLVLLPVALAIRGRSGARLLFDAREYYPRHYEDRLWWRWMFQPLNRDLCRRYMPRADEIVTVARGIAEEFKRECGVDCTLLPSMPAPRELAPQPVDPRKIRMIHHGIASRSRRLEVMIEMMDHVPEHFSLDLMLVPSDRPYTEELQALCARRRNVRVIPPVAFADLLTTSNAYDIGVFLVPPVSFNLRFALPNKFFEFVQSRLMVAIGPSPEMAHYVREHDLGVVADDFQPATLGRALARLTADDITRFKENADRAARMLNSDHTDAIVRRLVRDAPAAATP